MKIYTKAPLFKYVTTTFSSLEIVDAYFRELDSWEKINFSPFTGDDILITPNGGETKEDFWIRVVDELNAIIRLKPWYVNDIEYFTLAVDGLNEKVTPNGYLEMRDITLGDALLTFSLQRGGGLTNSQGEPTFYPIISDLTDLVSTNPPKTWNDQQSQHIRGLD